MSKGRLIAAIVVMLFAVALSSYIVYHYGVVPALSAKPDQHEDVTEDPAAMPDEDLYLTTTSLLQLSPLLPTTRIRRTGQVREFHLEAREVDWQIMPGVVVKAVTYNGRVPGPTIEVTEGDLVRVTLKNSLTYDTSIHWHGIHLPNKQDGVPGVTQEPIAPGETYTYEFVAGHAGTYMYHPHVNSVRQIDNGLYGPLIIHPQEPERQPVFDRDYTLMLGGWNVLPEQIDRETMLSKMGLSALHDDPHGEMTPDNSAEHDGMGGMGGMDYNFWTINGKAFPASPELFVKTGERVRIRLINISNANHPMHMHGTDFRVIAEDGHPLPHPKIINTIDVAPGKIFDIEFIADNPGLWLFHCHELHHTENDGVEPGGLISIIKYGDITPVSPPPKKGHGSSGKGH